MRSRQVTYMALYYIFFIASLRGNIGKNILRKYRSDIFVCTSLRGHTNIEEALNANYIYIYGIEDNKILFEHALKSVVSSVTYFKPTYLKGYFFYNDASTKLFDVLKLVKNSSVTILCNSYYPETENPEKTNNILELLEFIQLSDLKKCTILIDYVHRTGKISLKQIIDKLLEINPHYVFSFEQGGHLGNESRALLSAYIE
jgi:hypothetical protein